MQALQHRDVRGETDRERRQKNMQRDHPEELKSRQQYRVGRHRLSRADFVVATIPSLSPAPCALPVGCNGLGCLLALIRGLTAPVANRKEYNEYASRLPTIQRRNHVTPLSHDSTAAS